MIQIEDLVEADRYLDRKKMAEQTGIHYQTLSGKINRFKNGRNPTLSLAQSKALKIYFKDIHDVMYMTLNQNYETNPDM